MSQFAEDLLRYQMASQQAQNAQAQYQQMGQYWQQILAAHNSLMGGLGMSQGAYGSAGMLQRAGLGSAKPTIVKLPEEVVVEALIGWRRWSVSMFGEILLSNNGTQWTPYEKLSAACSATVCKGLDCGCGIYAYKDRKQAEQGDNAPTDLLHVWGEVSLWGRVIEYTKGFRAQFAYPKAFVNSGGIAQRLATVYGVQLIA